MIGQIIKIISNDCSIYANGKTYTCKPRGKLRNQNITPKVGDYVKFDNKDNCIEEILNRKNSLERPFVSNIDQALIITSLKSPEFSSNLLDKLLLICFINNIKPIICITKKDLLTKKEYKFLKPTLNYYRKIGYKVVFNTNLFKIKRLFKNKTTVLAGQSGSGKSTLLNKLDKNLNFETNEISVALGRGKHTTRYVSLVDMYHGKVLDTPGFSSIDLSSYSDNIIRDSFVEFNNYKCKYKDCMHIKEDNCNVKKNVNKSILKSRYDNYIKFIEKR